MPPLKHDEEWKYRLQNKLLNVKAPKGKRGKPSLRKEKVLSIYDNKYAKTYPPYENKTEEA